MNQKMKDFHPILILPLIVIICLTILTAMLIGTGLGMMLKLIL